MARVSLTDGKRQKRQRDSDTQAAATRHAPPSPPSAAESESAAAIGPPSECCTKGDAEPADGLSSKPRAVYGARSLPSSRSAQPAPFSIGRIEDAKAALATIDACDGESLAIPEDDDDGGGQLGSTDITAAAPASSSAMAAACGPSFHDSNESRVPGSDAAGQWGGEGLGAAIDPELESEFVAVTSQPKISRTSLASSAVAVAAVHRPDGAEVPSATHSRGKRQQLQAAADAAELRRVQVYLREVDDEVIPVESS